MSPGTDRWSSRPSLPPDLARNAQPLADRLRGSVLACLLPIGLTSALIAAYVMATGRSAEPSRAVVDGAYGLAGLVAIAVVIRWLDEPARRATIRFDRPDRTELVWTVGFLPLGIAAFLGGVGVARRLGFDLPSLGYSLADPVTLTAVVFGTVIVAPVVEEVLFRGLLLGSLLGRGFRPAVAAAMTVLFFAAVHVIALGVAGVFAIAAWAVFPTLLRLRFDNLTGAWLLHFLNNLYANLVVVALGWA